MKLRENFCIQLFEEINSGAGEGGGVRGDVGIECCLLWTGKWHFYCGCGAHTHTRTRTRTRTPNLPHNEFHKLTQIKDTTS